MRVYDEYYVDEQNISRYVLMILLEFICSGKNERNEIKKIKNTRRFSFDR